MLAKSFLELQKLSNEKCSRKQENSEFSLYVALPELAGLHFSYGPCCLVSRHYFDQKLCFQSKLRLKFVLAAEILRAKCCRNLFFFVDSMKLH